VRFTPELVGVRLNGVDEKVKATRQANGGERRTSDIRVFDFLLRIDPDARLTRYSLVILHRAEFALSSGVRIF
jgi:hypothetical protein